MRQCRLLAITILILAVGCSSVAAATFTYTLSRSLGLIQYSEQQRGYAFSFGQQFASIDSVTIHLAGYIFADSSTNPGSAAQGLLDSYDGTLRGLFIASEPTIDGPFDVTSTFTDQSTYVTEWRQAMCSGNIIAQLQFNPSDTSSKSPGPYAEITASTLTIVGTPVGTPAPEPSSLLALAAGLMSLIAGVRKKTL